jgi:hypothetical protein
MYLASKTLDDNGRYRLVLSSALVAGFALGTHYPAGLVFLCPLISFSMVEFRIPSRWPVGLGLVGCLIVGALFGLPAIFWNLNGVLAALSSTHYGFITRPESLSYLDQLVLPQEAGWPFALVGAAGLLRILRSPHPRDHFRPWILFLTIFTALYFFFDYQPLDNLLPILPLLCLAAATVFLGTEPPEKKPSIVSWLLIGGLCVVLALHCAPLVLNLANQQDSRSEAVQYLAATATAKDVIVVEKELAIHPAELAQLSSKIIELPATILLARLDGSKSSIVIGSSKLSSELRLRGYCAKASFGYTPKLDSPKKWRSSKQQVDIWAPCKK